MPKRSQPEPKSPPIHEGGATESAERSPRNLSIDLPAELSAEIRNVAAQSGLLNESKIRDLVRERALAAATSATLHNVAAIVSDNLREKLARAARPTPLPPLPGVSE